MAIPFRAITTFHATVSAGSVSAAARQLGVTPSAVSQQLALLETYVGTALLLKVGRGVKLTEAGETYFGSIAGEVAQVLQATDRLRGHRTVTTLTVRATPSLSTKWLLPRLSSFVDAFPQLELRIDGTNEPTDFSREDVDVELRHGRGQWRGLYIEGLAEERHWPIAAPGLLPASSLPAAGLAAHRLIHSVRSQVQWPQWFAAAGLEPEARWRRVLFDRTHMAIDAAADGMGVALESDLMFWRDWRAGRIVCPVFDAPSPQPIVTQWIVCPSEKLHLSRVQCFLEWLRHERDLWQADLSAHPIC